MYGSKKQEQLRSEPLVGWGMEEHWTAHLSSVHVLEWGKGSATAVAVQLDPCLWCDGQQAVVDCQPQEWGKDGHLEWERERVNGKESPSAPQGPRLTPKS